MKNLEWNQVRIIVDCQYYENYAADQDFLNKPIWKSKGESQFTFVIDSDEWMYDDDRIKASVQRIISSKCNGFCKYEIVGYETLFFQPEDITDEVKAMMSSLV